MIATLPSREISQQQTNTSLTNASYNKSNLIFSTYFGGPFYDKISDIAVDNAGNIIIVGETNTTSFPTLHAYQPKYQGLNDIFISKFNSNGSLVFSTYFGGTQDDFVNAIAVDKNNNIFITGYTQSKYFPTKNAFNNSFSYNSFDVFVAKFSPSGQLVFSTFLGGSGAGMFIAIDNSGNCVVAGETYSPNFPLKNAFNSTFNKQYYAPYIFVTKLSSTGSLIYSTFFGLMGSSLSLAVDSQGNSYLAGFSTTQTPFTNKVQSNTQVSNELFVAKFSTFGQLLFSIPLGNESYGYGPLAIAVDKGENIYVTGTTNSQNFPLKNAYQKQLNGPADCFLTKLNVTGQLLFSTYLGGNGVDYPNEMVVDNSGYIYIEGFTNSPNFPSTSITQNPVNTTLMNQGSYYSFIAHFNTNGSLLFSSVISWSLGDSMLMAINNQGNTFLVGNFAFGNPPPFNNTNDSQIQSKNIYIAEYGSFNYPNVYITPYTVPEPVPIDLTLIAVVGIGTIGSLIAFSLVIIEYRRYGQQKKALQEANSKTSFVTYIKQVFAHKLSKKKINNQLSEETLEKLEELIEEEQNELHNSK